MSSLTNTCWDKFLKCDGSFNTADDSYARGCVLNKVENKNMNLFNLMSGLKKQYFYVSINSYCKYGLNERGFNSKKK